MKAFPRRCWFFLASVVGLGAFLLLDAERGAHAVSVTACSLREMVLLIPPVFLLLGLLDVRVPRKNCSAEASNGAVRHSFSRPRSPLGWSRRSGGNENVD